MKRRWILAFAVLLAGTAAFPWLCNSWAQRINASRDEWQRPADVMDTLGLRAGSAVADVGCGEGYFVMHLARRVGSEGRVFAVDTDVITLRKLRRAVEEEKLSQVEVVESRPNDTLLPREALDVVLTVNAYHEMREYDAMLHSIHQALKPGGLLAVIDATGSEDATRSSLQSAHTSTETMVKEDAIRNGFRFRAKERGFQNPESRRRDWFFLVFEKPAE